MVILPETGQTGKLPADIFSWSVRYRLSLVFTLRASSAAQCIVIGPVCGCNGRAGGVRTLLQPARAQCVRLSECFFIVFFVLFCLVSDTSAIDEKTLIIIIAAGAAAVVVVLAICIIAACRCRRCVSHAEIRCLQGENRQEFGGRTYPTRVLSRQYGITLLPILLLQCTLGVGMTP